MGFSYCNLKLKRLQGELILFFDYILGIVGRRSKNCFEGGGQRKYKNQLSANLSLWEKKRPRENAPRPFKPIKLNRIFI